MRRPLLLVALLGIVATVFGVTSGSAARGSLSQGRLCGVARWSAGGRLKRTTLAGPISDEAIIEFRTNSS